MAGGDVEELLGGSRGPYVPACEPRTHRWSQTGKLQYGIGDVRQLVALSGEAPDVPTEGFSSLLLVVFEILWVPRTLVHALEVPHKDLFQVRLTLDSVGRQVLQPRSCRIGQEQWKVADNEVVIVCTTGFAGKPIVFEPLFGVCFSRVLWDIS